MNLLIRPALQSVIAAGTNDSKQEFSLPAAGRSYKLLLSYLKTVQDEIHFRT
jgi:hypothetical protein